MNEGVPTVTCNYKQADENEVLKTQNDLARSCAQSLSCLHGVPMEVKIDFSTVPENYGIPYIMRGDKLIYISEDSGIDIHSLSNSEITKLLNTHKDGEIVTG